MTFLTVTDALNYHQKKYQISKQLESIVTKKGYRLIEPDYLESYDRFIGMHRRVNVQSMVKLIDAEGAVRVLRPDITTSVINELIPKWNNGLTLKLFYNASVFINTTENIQEKKQFGVEYLGDDSQTSDHETIGLVLEIFNAFTLDFFLEISHAGFLNALIERLDLSEKNAATFKTLLYTKNRDGLNRFIESYLPNHPDRKIIERLFDLQGETAAIRQKLDGLNVPEALRRALDELSALEASFHCVNCTFDLSLIGQFDYYDGIFFKGYLMNSPQAILHGGRYNTRKMGYQKQVPAIGFSFALNDLLKAVT